MGRMSEAAGPWTRFWEESDAMTETEWLACADPSLMLEFLKDKVSDRKLRLFACACHEPIWHLLSDKTICRKTIEFAERLADGLATTNELHGQAWGKPGSAFSVVLYKAWDAATNSIEFAAGTAKQAVLRLDPAKYKAREEAFKAAWENHGLGEAMRMADAAMPIEWITPGELAWAEGRASQCKALRDIFGNPFRHSTLDPRRQTTAVVNLARAIYDERAFDKLPLLADELKKAGWANEEIIAHCRGPGPHVRGCWVVDKLLAKE
jgi:hypothetical protein